MEARLPGYPQLDFGIPKRPILPYAPLRSSGLLYNLHQARGMKIIDSITRQHSRFCDRLPTTKNQTPQKTTVLSLPSNLTQKHGTLSKAKNQFHWALNHQTHSSNDRRLIQTKLDRRRFGGRQGQV